MEYEYFSRKNQGTLVIPIRKMNDVFDWGM